MNNSYLSLKSDIHSIKRKNRILTIVALSLAGLLGLSWLDNRVQSTNNVTYFENLRTRQITVEDENGNDRIVISPKISTTKSRRRTDAVSGVLVLDDMGIDRTVLGATPTFQKNNKITSRSNNGDPYGVVFNDDRGDERGGIGYYSDRRLASLGLDSSAGEGLALFVAEDNHYGQKLGLVMNEKGQKVYLGSNAAGDVILNLDSPQNSRLEFIVDSKGKTTVKHYDLRKNKFQVVFKSK